MPQPPVVTKEERWRRWKGTFPDGLLDIVDLALRLVREADASLPDDMTGVRGNLVIADGRHVTMNGTGDFAYWLKEQSPPLDGADISRLELSVGNGQAGLVVTVRFDPGRDFAVELRVSGSDLLRVPGVFEEMKRWIDKGRRIGNWDPWVESGLPVALSALMLLLGVVVLWGFSTDVGLFVLGASLVVVVMPLLAAACVAIAIPKLELLRPGRVTAVSSWGTKVTKVVSYLVVAFVAAFVGALAQRLADIL